jgi:hypothetical protein
VTYRNFSFGDCKVEQGFRRALGQAGWGRLGLAGLPGRARRGRIALKVELDCRDGSEAAMSGLAA